MFFRGMFFERFEQYAILSGLRGTNLDLHLLNLVEDDTMYKKLKNVALTPLHKSSVSTLIQALRESLFPAAESRLLRSTLSNMKQSYEESVEVYAMRISDVAGKAYSDPNLREEASLSTLLSGISEVSIRQKLMESEVQTFEYAARLALKLERISKAVGDNTRPAGGAEPDANFEVFTVDREEYRQRDQSNLASVVVCSNCSKMYHAAENCWRDKTCQICFKKGHVDSVCRSRNQDLGPRSHANPHIQQGHYSYHCSQNNERVSNTPSRNQQRTRQRSYLNDFATGHAQNPIGSSRSNQIIG